jgi:hypothetical protein
MSRSQLGRMERGERASVGLVEVAAALAVVGMDLSARAYPAGTPQRDRAHARLLERLRVLLPPELGWRAEVPFPNAGDLRSWDAMVKPGDVRVAIEAETRASDCQELQRRMSQKRRDGGCDRLLLLFADTRANRAFVQDNRAALLIDFPVTGTAALRALVAGRDPGGDAIVLR